MREFVHIYKVHAFLSLFSSHLDLEEYPPVGVFRGGIGFVAWLSSH